MAGDEATGRGSGGGVADGVGAQVADRLGFEHTHAAGTTALVVVLAVVAGRYAGWLLADVGLRWVAFVVVAALAGYGLYGQPTARSVVVRGLYTLAALLLVTPVAIDATFLLAAPTVDGVGNPWAFVFTVADLVYLVVFALFAAIPAGLGWLISRRA